MQAKSNPQTRRAVLGLVLYEHPAELSSYDLRREIGDDARGAIVDLLAAGLLKRRRGGAADASGAELLSTGTVVTIGEKFGENVMIYRRRAGLSQEELGFMASLHRTEISHLERGLRVPKIDTLVKLAGALSVPPGDLLKGIAWKPGLTRSGRFLSS